MTATTKPVSSSLGKPIAFRLSEADREDYLARVAASGLTQSEFFRQAILSSNIDVVAKTGTSQNHKELLSIVSKASVKLNGIATLAQEYHQKDALSEKVFSEILDDLDAISRFLKLALNQTA